MTIKIVNGEDNASKISSAFRGSATITDSNPNCEYESTDTDVVDVVKMVSAAFLGANPLTGFCNSCQ